MKCYIDVRDDEAIIHGPLRMTPEIYDMSGSHGGEYEDNSLHGAVSWKAVILVTHDIRLCT
jgi:hypothetical protein